MMSRFGGFDLTSEVLACSSRPARAVLAEVTVPLQNQESYEIELAAGWNTVVFETVGVAESIGYGDCRDVHASVQPFPRAQVAWHFVSAR